MPSADSNDTKTSKAGISTSSSGDRVIASSVRADGSVRKEIRVRPGYRPPEDVEVYKNRTADAWKNRGSGGVPGAESVNKPDGKQGSTTSNKNAKRREARKKAAAANAGKQVDEAKEEQNGNPNEASVEEPKEEVDPEAHKEKEAKKLTKKLRQARELKDKKDKGDALLPEQFEKVIKINELIRQLELLGFDANGDKKVIPEAG